MQINYMLCVDRNVLYFTYWTYKKFGNGGWDTLLKGIKIIYSRSKVCYIEISSSRMQSFDRFPYCKVNTNGNVVNARSSCWVIFDN